MGKHRYNRPTRLPVLTGDAFLRRRLSIEPHCHWCRRKVFNPRNKAQVDAALVAAVDYKDPRGDSDDERNCVLVCTECKEARSKLDQSAFGKRIQSLRANHAEKEEEGSSSAGE